ncbi:MAG: hypothetical protein WAX79_03140, partial [Candidatus Omnitrophota bacterium]
LKQQVICHSDGKGEVIEEIIIALPVITHLYTRCLHFHISGLRNQWDTSFILAFPLEDLLKLNLLRIEKGLPSAKIIPIPQSHLYRFKIKGLSKESTASSPVESKEKIINRYCRENGLDLYGSSPIDLKAIPILVNLLAAEGKAKREEATSLLLRIARQGAAAAVLSEIIKAGKYAAVNPAFLARAAYITKEIFLIPFSDYFKKYLPSADALLLDLVVLKFLTGRKMPLGSKGLIFSVTGEFGNQLGIIEAVNLRFCDQEAQIALAISQKSTLFEEFATLEKIKQGKEFILEARCMAVIIDCLRDMLEMGIISPDEEFSILVNLFNDASLFLSSTDEQWKDYLREVALFQKEIKALLGVFCLCESSGATFKHQDNYLPLIGLTFRGNIPFASIACLLVTFYLGCAFKAYREMKRYKGRMAMSTEDLTYVLFEDFEEFLKIYTEVKDRDKLLSEISGLIFKIEQAYMHRKDFYRASSSLAQKKALSAASRDKGASSPVDDRNDSGYLKRFFKGEMKEISTSSARTKKTTFLRRLKEQIAKKIEVEEEAWKGVKFCLKFSRDPGKFLNLMRKGFLKESDLGILINLHKIPLEQALEKFDGVSLYKRVKKEINLLEREKISFPAILKVLFYGLTLEDLQKLSIFRKRSLSNMANRLRRRQAICRLSKLGVDIYDLAKPIAMPKKVSYYEYSTGIKMARVFYKGVRLLFNCQKDCPYLKDLEGGRVYLTPYLDRIEIAIKGDGNTGINAEEHVFRIDSEGFLLDLRGGRTSLKLREKSESSDPYFVISEHIPGWNKASVEILKNNKIIKTLLNEPQKRAPNSLYGKLLRATRAFW